jgi:hypothetical protein
MNYHQTQARSPYRQPEALAQFTVRIWQRTLSVASKFQAWMDVGDDVKLGDGTEGTKK